MDIIEVIIRENQRLYLFIEIVSSLWYLINKIRVGEEVLPLHMIYKVVHEKLREFYCILVFFKSDAPTKSIQRDPLTCDFYKVNFDGATFEASLFLVHLQAMQWFNTRFSKES